MGYDEILDRLPSTTGIQHAEYLVEELGP